MIYSDITDEPFFNNPSIYDIWIIFSYEPNRDITLEAMVKIGLKIYSRTFAQVIAYLAVLPSGESKTYLETHGSSYFSELLNTFYSLLFYLLVK